MPDGSTFVYENENSNSERAGAYDNSKVTSPADVATNNNVPQNDTSVNTYSTQNSENVSEKDGKAGKDGCPEFFTL